MKSVEETLERLTEECLDSFARWDDLYRNGGQDPFWADGTNLNLVRNHIIYYKREIQELCETEGIFKPDVFYRELPPEVDDNYMAKSEQIRQEAVSILSRQTESNEYNRLRTAIENDDLLIMRRYGFYDSYNK